MAEIACLQRQCVDNGSAMCICRELRQEFPFSLSLMIVYKLVFAYLGYGFFLFEIII